jgi:hypothetical protein
VRAAISISALDAVAGLSPCAGRAACALRWHESAAQAAQLAGERPAPLSCALFAAPLAFGKRVLKKLAVRLVPDVTRMRLDIPRLALFYAAAAEHSTPAA